MHANTPNYVYAMLRKWNMTNPELPVRITPNQIAQRVKAARMTSEQRFIKGTAPELRGIVRHELAGKP
ncbi:MAG: hypothetical protein Q8O37_11760 [Sulfuricellaceae bacterium]|nr:hypothetical protein [Sulfuricellaceae bacterium]